MADADLDEVQALTEDDDASEATAAAEPAPQCAGCHRRGVGLTLLENGKRYCERCAHEVERLMGIGPLFPAATTDTEESESDESDTGAHDPAALETVEDLLDATAEVALASADEAVADLDRPQPIAETPVTAEPVLPAPVAAEPDTGETPEATAELAVDVAPDESAEPAVEATQPSNDEIATDPESPAEPDGQVEATEAVAASAPAAEAPDTTDAAAVAELTTLVASANHESADSASSLITRPAAASEITTEIDTEHAAEEPPLMERVQEQTRPARLEPAASAPAGPPSDLHGVLAAERARLLDQRELLEARFRAETEVIDERLVHVESLLGDQRESIAS